MKKNRILPKEIKKAARVLKNGGIVGFPTETSFGILANAFDETAVKKIYAVKGRKETNPFPILVKNIEMAGKIVKSFSGKQLELIEKYWPGALTILFEASEDVPKILLNERNEIALRISDSENITSLFERIDFPVTATSANPSGFKSAYTSSKVEAYFEKSLDFIVPGVAARYSKPSTIIRVINEKIEILREGRIRLTT